MTLSSKKFRETRRKRKDVENPQGVGLDVRARAIHAGQKWSAISFLSYGNKKKKINTRCAMQLLLSDYFFTPSVLPLLPRKNLIFKSKRTAIEKDREKKRK